MKRILLAATTACLMTNVSATRAADVEFWYGNTGRVEQAIQNACDAFNQSQTAHTVTCVGQGGYEIGMQRAIAAYRSGRAPVMIQFFDAGTLDLMLSGAVVPVQEIMPDVDWDAYIQGARSYYETSDGELVSQPYNGSTLILYANMDQLAEVGVDTLPATYEELLETARLLRENGHQCPFATDGSPWRLLEQFAARHDVPIATKANGFDGLDAEYVFNQGLIAEHMANLSQWREDGLLRLEQDLRADTFSEAFNAGECAMVENSTGGYGSAYEALGDAVQIAYAPMYEGHERHNTLIGGASIWVMKGHSDEKIQAAQAFLDFVRRNDQQIEFTRMTGYVPMTDDALAQMKSDGLLEQPEFATATTGVESLNMPAGENSRGIRLGFYVQFRDIFVEETQRAFNGEQTMEVALDNAKRRGDELLRRFEQTYQDAALH